MQLRRIVPATAFLLAVLASTTAAQAQDPVAHGRALLKEFCAGCHAIGKTGRSRHVGAPPFRYLGRSYDLDQFPQMLERGFSSGHPDMPTYKFIGRDARDAADYLRTIQE